MKKIIKKYSSIESNSDNYSIGGGLSDSGKKASNRHEDALADKGKLTLGKAAQMFKKATGLDISLVNDILNYAVPNMEWHHAGFLPKKFGGGMKKTYFLNAKEIVEIATNWQEYVDRLAISKNEKRIAALLEVQNLNIKRDFLLENATRITRVSTKPANFYETDREMNGKFGWFSSYGKSYNMTEYFSGWSFENIELLEEFLNI